MLVQGHIRKLEGSPKIGELTVEVVERCSEESPLLEPDTS